MQKTTCDAGTADKDKESGQWRINTSNVQDDALPDSRKATINGISLYDHLYRLYTTIEYRMIFIRITPTPSQI